MLVAMTNVDILSICYCGVLQVACVLATEDVCGGEGGGACLEVGNHDFAVSLGKWALGSRYNPNCFVLPPWFDSGYVVSFEGESPCGIYNMRTLI